MCSINIDPTLSIQYNHNTLSPTSTDGELQNQHRCLMPSDRCAVQQKIVQLATDRLQRALHESESYRSKVTVLGQQIQSMDNNLNALIQTMCIHINQPSSDLIMDTIDELPKTVDNIQTEIDALRAKILHMKPLEQDYCRNNEVYLCNESKAVFKLGQKVTISELRAYDICCVLGFPEAIVPSRSTTITGHIERRAIFNSDSEISYTTYGLVQPLIPSKWPCAIFYTDPTLFASIADNLDTTDTQKKTIMQGLLANWDLHPSNANFLPCDLDDTHQERKEPLQMMSSSLPSTTTKKWQVSIFDNEDTFSRSNNFVMWEGEPCIPIHSFLLGLAVNQQLLTTDVILWLETFQEKISLIEQKYLNEKPKIWDHFDQKLQRKLLRAFDKIYDFKDRVDALKYIPTSCIADIATILHIKGVLPRPDAAHKFHVPVIDTCINAILTTCSNCCSEEDVKPIRTLMTSIQLRISRIPYHYTIRSLNTYLETSGLNTKIRQLKMASANKTEILKQIIPLKMALIDYDTIVVTSDERYSAIWKYRDALQEFLANNLFPRFHPRELQSLLQRIQIAANYPRECKKLNSTPTVYGLHCQLFPYFHFFIDLLADINCKIEQNRAVSTPIEKLKPEMHQKLLSDAINPFLDGPAEQGHYSTVSCRYILDKAIGLQVVTKNDERYKKAHAALSRFENGELD